MPSDGSFIHSPHFQVGSFYMFQDLICGDPRLEIISLLQVGPMEGP